MDMFKMFGKMKDMQKKVDEIKKHISTLQATGESGGGLVKVIINGKKKILSLDIDNTLLKENEKTILEDLIVAATNIATKNIEIKIKDTIQNNYKDMLGNLPIDLENLF